MKIGLIDVDGHNFPNLPLMKLSAWHKKQGDSVEWYEPLFSGHMNKVYMSKVFSFSPDYPYYIDADEIIQGGTGYCISTVDEKEVFDVKRNNNFADDIEHIYPDYSLYPAYSDVAFGFLTRGCPRACKFCHVAAKEGRKSYKVADLEEFWRGQKEIQLMDPNLLACSEHLQLLQQLVDSKSWVDVNQGFDARFLTEANTKVIRRIKMKMLHFAWDNYSDRNIIIPKLKAFKAATGWDKRKMVVYVLVNFGSTFEQDLERVYTLRDMGYWPYVTIYNKESLPKGHELIKLQRWVNMRAIFENVRRFEDYTG